MKKTNNTNQLLEIEWNVLKILWEKGVMSVKEVWTSLYPNAEKAYTTIQTYMDRMVDKHLLEKQKIGLVNFYHARVAQTDMVKKATDTLVSRVFNGSFGTLAAFLVDSDKLNNDDLQKIKKLIEQKEKEM